MCTEDGLALNSGFTGSKTRGQFINPSRSCVWLVGSGYSRTLDWSFWGQSPNPVQSHVSYNWLPCKQLHHTSFIGIIMSQLILRTKLYLIEESLWELLETLGAHEALLVVKFPVTVHDLLCRGEAALTALAHGVGQSVGHVAERRRKIIIRIKIYFQIHIKCTQVKHRK